MKIMFLVLLFFGCTLELEPVKTDQLNPTIEKNRGFFQRNYEKSTNIYPNSKNRRKK